MRFQPPQFPNRAPTPITTPLPKRRKPQQSHIQIPNHEDDDSEDDVLSKEVYEFALFNEAMDLEEDSFNENNSVNNFDPQQLESSSFGDKSMPYKYNSIVYKIVQSLSDNGFSVGHNISAKLVATRDLSKDQKTAYTPLFRWM